MIALLPPMTAGQSNKWNGRNRFMKLDNRPRCNPLSDKLVSSAR